jgi:ACS family pantothenate transporter-like MFS transporter
MGAPNPLFFGWINRLCKRNAEGRAIIMGSVFMIGWAFFAWVPLVAYKTVEAPRWTIGMLSSFPFLCALSLSRT